MFPIKTTVAATLAVATLASAPMMAQEITIDTALGEVSVPANPETVIVYDMGALDMLDALDVPVASSIGTIYVDYLKDYEGIAGTLFEPDLEAIYGLEPDLIIAGGRSASQVEALSDIATTIDMTNMSDQIVAHAEDQLVTYGELFGKQDEAQAILADFDAKVAEAAAAVEGKGNGLIVLTNGPRISAYGSGSRFGWLHEAVGLPEAVEDLEAATHGESVSFEFIRDVNPDWLLVIDRVAAINAEGDSAQATLDNPLVAETNAWKNGHVVYLNAADIYIAGGGIQSMSNTLDIVIEAFSGANS